MLQRLKGLAVARTDLQRFESVSAVKESVRAHYQNLERLSANLRKLGIDEQTIDEHVIALFNEYKEELAKAMAASSASDFTIAM